MAIQSVMNTPIIETLDIKERFTDIEGDFLQRLARQVARKNGIFVEIGSWKGHSSSFLGQVAKDYGCHLYCVDHWKGTIGVKEHEGAKNCLDIFRHNMELLGLSEYVHPLVMESSLAVKIFADGVADLVFIDADHSYQAVKADIMMWLPKVRNGGVLCGHDAETFYTYVLFGDEWLDKAYITVWRGEKKIDVHPGVLRALYDCFADTHGIAKDTNIWFIKVKKPIKEV